MIAVIYAKSANNVIGNKNTLPWKLSKDLKHFQSLTKDNIVVMGRNTWESLPIKPLPKRFNVVLSSTLKPASIDPSSIYYQDRIRNIENDSNAFIAFVDSFEFIHKLDKAINDFKLNKDIYLIGGKSVIEDGLKIATDAFITEIHREYTGRTKVEDLDLNVWQEYSRVKNTENEISFDFVHYKRKLCPM